MKKIFVILFFVIHIFLASLCIYLFISVNNVTKRISFIEYQVKYHNNPILCYVECGDVINEKMELTVVIVNNANDEFLIDINYDNLEDAIQLKVDNELVDDCIETSSHKFTIVEGINVVKKYVIEVKDKKELAISINVPLTNIQSKTFSTKLFPNSINFEKVYTIHR